MPVFNDPWYSTKPKGSDESCLRILSKVALEISMLSNNNLRFMKGVLDIANNTNRALLFQASFIASFNGLFNGSNPRQPVENETGYI